MTILIINIDELLQVRDNTVLKVSGLSMSDLPSIKNAFLEITNSKISNFGSMSTCPKFCHDKIIDANGRTVMPAFCDSHSHLVYAGNRSQEFVDRINGLTYEEIANRGGGILNSAMVLNQTSEDDLYNQSVARLLQVMKLGTGAIEIKSGYGLTVAGELKILRVVKKLKENFPIHIEATFLGAHAIPEIYKNNRLGYIDLIINEMIPAVALEKLATFIDVFCETGYFSPKETDLILKAGKKAGLIPKIHVNQFNAIGGIKVAVDNNALTVDHLEVLSDNDLEILQNSNTMVVALPSCSYFLGIPYTPIRNIINKNVAFALATDYNPGSSPSGNMSFVVADACIKMKLTPEEAINAATINGAYAMGISDTHGSITVDKVANIIITKPIKNFYQIPYEFASNLIETVIINGKVV